jgi:hypothetical protein
MKPQTLSHIVWIVIISVCCINPVAGQQTDTLRHRYNNYIGWGVSVGSGSAQQARLGLMYSTSYTRTLLDKISLDASLNVSQRDFHLNNIIPFSDVTYAHTAIFTDISLFYQLGQCSRSSLHIGLGASIQYQNAFFSSYLPPQITMGFGGPQNIFFQQIIDAYSLGGNLKLDYNIPVRDSNCEIGIRAQGHFFAVPFTGLVERFPAQITTAPIQYGGWSARLGVFLRFGV